jgi:hypothetical protein
MRWSCRYATRTASGKVDRAELSRRLEDELSGEGGVRRAVP